MMGSFSGTAFIQTLGTARSTLSRVRFEATFYPVTYGGPGDGGLGSQRYLHGMPDVVIREIRSVEDVLFFDAMELYVESFPRDERMPVREIAAQVASPFWHMVIASADGALVGLSWFGYVPMARLGFIIYLAVDPGFRRGGVGRRLVSAAIEQCRSDASSLGHALGGVCFEVERVDLALTDVEKSVRLKRLAWFESLGAECLSPGYTQPAMAPDRNPVPLNLMAFGVAPRADRAKIARDFCAHCVGYEPDAPEVTLTLDQLSLKWR